MIANPNFGFQVSESGAGYTWCLNSRENQLTPWSNDPVTDPPGEVLYVRDEETGTLWTPTVLPIREEAWSYVARHGQGYSAFEHTSHGISLALLQCVPPEDPVKISRLVLENRSGRHRRLSVTAYVEWVLGPSRSAAAPFIVTEIDPDTGALLARNPLEPRLRQSCRLRRPGREPTDLTGDRTEFLGPQRDAGPSGGARKREGALGPRRRRPRSVRRHPDRGRAARRRPGGGRVRCWARRPPSRKRGRWSPGTAPSTSTRCCRR